MDEGCAGKEEFKYGISDGMRGKRERDDQMHDFRGEGSIEGSREAAPCECLGGAAEKGKRRAGIGLAGTRGAVKSVLVVCGWDVGVVRVQN
jgi:hypothetical protein